MTRNKFHAEDPHIRQNSTKFSCHWWPGAWNLCSPAVRVALWNKLLISCDKKCNVFFCQYQITPCSCRRAVISRLQGAIGWVILHFHGEKDVISATCIEEVQTVASVAWCVNICNYWTILIYNEDILFGDGTISFFIRNFIIVDFVILRRRLILYRYSYFASWWDPHCSRCSVRVIRCWKIWKASFLFSITVTVSFGCVLVIRVVTHHLLFRGEHESRCTCLTC